MNKKWYKYYVKKDLDHNKSFAFLVIAVIFLSTFLLTFFTTIGELVIEKQRNEINTSFLCVVVYPSDLKIFTTHFKKKFPKEVSFFSGYSMTWQSKNAHNLLDGITLNSKEPFFFKIRSSFSWKFANKGFITKLSNKITSHIVCGNAGVVMHDRAFGEANITTKEQDIFISWNNNNGENFDLQIPIVSKLSSQYTLANHDFYVTNLFYENLFFKLEGKLPKKNAIKIYFSNIENYVKFVHFAKENDYRHRAVRYSDVNFFFNVSSFSYNVINYLIYLSILLVSLISCTTFCSHLESKKSDIAILKVLGFKTHTIVFIFLRKSLHIAGFACFCATISSFIFGVVSWGYLNEIFINQWKVINSAFSLKNYIYYTAYSSIKMFTIFSLITTIVVMFVSLHATSKKDIRL